MKICVFVFLLVSYVSTDCGCLKCSKHLQGVDVPGPAGFPVKVIFRRPKPKGCNCCCDYGAPTEPPPKVKEFSNFEKPGGHYSATVQLPLSVMPKPRLTLKNLKYRTDTVLVPPPSSAAVNQPNSVFSPASLTSADILNWLNSLQLATQQQKQQPQQQQQQEQQQQDPVVGPVSFIEYQQCRGNPTLDNTYNTENQMSQGSFCNCQRSKRSISSTKDQINKEIPSSTPPERSRRDLAKRGYNLLMNMLPQYVREPVHHSLQGTNYLQTKPQPTIIQKLNDLMSKKSANVQENFYDQHKAQPHYLLPQLSNIFNQPSTSLYAHKNLNHLQNPKSSRQSFLDQHLVYEIPSQLNGLRDKGKEPLLVQTNTFGSTKKSPKSAFTNREDPLGSRKYSTLENKIKLRSINKKDPSVTPSPLLENSYKMFLKRYGAERSQSAIPKLAQRLDDRGGADEKTLLKKLKKLNNNPYSSNLEDQATVFMQQLLKPEESKKRNRRSSKDLLEKDLSRKKRTIILGSDELELPPHYEIEVVSAEEESEENQSSNDLEHFEEFEDEDPIVGISPFIRKLSPSRKLYSNFPSLQPKPEIILGKNVIQKAVREELEAHHKKLEKEQKLKEMKENLKRKKQQPFGVPQNPIFALLTAPVQFLKHFHDLNRGVSPVVSTIPKLVYTTKKVFKDLGKKFQRNCLDLVSNVIGDFDPIHPTIIQQLGEPDGRRFRRDVLQAEVKKCLKENQANTRVRQRNTNTRKNKGNKNEILLETKAINAEERGSSEIKIKKLDNTNKTDKSVRPVNQNNMFCSSSKRSNTRTKNKGNKCAILKETKAINAGDNTCSAIKVKKPCNTNKSDKSVEPVNQCSNICSSPKRRNTKTRKNNDNGNENLKETKALKSESKVSTEIKVKNLDQTNKTEKLVKLVNQSDILLKGENSNILNTNTNVVTNTVNNIIADNSTQLTNLVTNNQEQIEQMDDTKETIKESLNKESKIRHFAPDYSLVFKHSKEDTNFGETSEKHVRKKRYVVRVVDDDEIQDQVEDYLTEKFGDQIDYHNPLENYYEKVNTFLNKLYSTHEPLCQVGGECYYQRTAPAEEKEPYYEDHQESLESVEDSFEEKPTRKKIKIKKMKPRVIIDKKGRPFMEYNGYKRPLLIKGKKIGIMKKPSQISGSSSEESGRKIAALLARAKVDSDVVGNTQKDIIPQQLIKERISALLEEIDQLVHLNADDYDEIFEDLIKIEHIKISVEQDWKRMLINDKVDDMAAKIGLLSKFKELQYIKDSTVRKIASALKKNDNEFVRCQLVNSLISLQKLQCLITSVVEDFEQHLKMKTSFNAKKEIKYVDYLSGLKFAFAKTRNDLIKMLSKDRDSEGLKYMDMLHKLKKLLISADEDPEKIDQAAKLIWEMKNLEKLQIQTIKDMNKKLARNFKVKKELKILFDLQRRFEDCNKELCEFLGDLGLKNRTNMIGQKKDIKEVIAEVKRKHEEMLQKAKGRSSNLLKKS